MLRCAFPLVFYRLLSFYCVWLDVFHVVALFTIVSNRHTRAWQKIINFLHDSQHCMSAALCLHTHHQECSRKVKSEMTCHTHNILVQQLDDDVIFHISWDFSSMCALFFLWNHEWLITFHYFKEKATLLVRAAEKRVKKFSVVVGLLVCIFFSSQTKDLSFMDLKDWLQKRSELSSMLAVTKSVVKWLRLDETKNGMS